MKSFSDLTFQLDETMLGQSVVARKPRRSQLLRSIATNIKDRLMGGQKKRGDIDQKQVVKIRSGAMLSSLNPTRKQRLDQATKTLKRLRDSGKFGDPSVGYARSDARLRRLASGLGKRKDEINKAAEAIAARRGISVSDARKRLVRQVVSRAVNRMETKAARKRLNENLQQLDEVLPAVLAGAAGMKLLGGLSQTAPLVAAIGVHGATTSLGSAIGGGLSAIGDIGGAFMKNRMAQAMQKRAQRTQKRQALLSKQQSADMAMGVSPTTGVPSNIKINPNPRAPVAQLRGTGGTQLGGSSVGKQFAAKY